MANKIVNKINTREIKVPRSRNMYDVSSIYHLQQQLLVIGSYVKMLVRGVLSDRYRIRQENSSTKEYKYIWRFGPVPFVTGNRKLCKNAGA